MNDKPNWKHVMDSKKEHQIAMHELSYGAKLGDLKVEPTKEQLDADFEDRRAKGELFTQQINAN